MKKVYLLIVILMLVFYVSACGSSNSQQDGNVQSSKEGKVLSEKEFKQMYSDPKSYIGDRVEFYARIFTPVEKDSKGTYIQAFADSNNSEMNMIIAINDPDLEVDMDDIIFVDGIVHGEFKGENAYGGEVIAPQILADKVEKTDYATAFAPAIVSIDLNEEIDQHGYIFKINKVELAESETRMLVTITNNSKEPISFYQYSSKLIQGNKQHDEESNYEADYPEPQNDILPGITTDGIITFPPIDIELKKAQVIFEGSSDNWDVDIKPFVFDLEWD